GTSLTFTPPDNGSYTATFTATDKDGGSTIDFASVNVTNVVPVLTLGGNASLAQGSPFTPDPSAVDPGPDTIAKWSVNWGDGSSDVFNGSPSAVTHVYADGPGSYRVRASATDEDGTWAADSGFLDATFDNDGYVNVNFGDFVTLADGRIVGVGTV